MRRSRVDTVVPFTMEIMRPYLYPFHFFVRDLNLGGIFSFIQLRFDSESHASGCFSNQLHNDLMADQEWAPPIHTDMMELANSLPIPKLAEKAYALYEKFRPENPPGKKGWGASGKLDLALIRKMASA